MVNSLSNVIPSADSLQVAFTALLPRIENHARIYFRDIKCAGTRADRIAETIAIAWRWFRRLMRRGKDATRFISALASLAARAVRSGRRACGQVRGNDVFSPTAQRRFGFTVQSLSAMRSSDDLLCSSPRGQQRRHALEDLLQHNTVTPILDQVVFRVDFPDWLKTLTPRERHIIGAMSLTERTKDLSRRFHVTPGRISQMRKEFGEKWRRFCGDTDHQKKSDSR